MLEIYSSEEDINIYGCSCGCGCGCSCICVPESGRASVSSGDEDVLNDDAGFDLFGARFCS